MAIPESIKTVGTIALLVGGGVMVYQSLTASNRLHEAIKDIRAAQVLIKGSIDTIESAKMDVKDVQKQLKLLQDLASESKKTLDNLRSERAQLEKTIKESVANSRDMMREQKRIVDEFQKEKRAQDALVDRISKLEAVPLSPIKK
jgi:chromosome segregation ATPase